jgi:hypothetical protein
MLLDTALFIGLILAAFAGLVVYAKRNGDDAP